MKLFWASDVSRYGYECMLSMCAHRNGSKDEKELTKSAWQRLSSCTWGQWSLKKWRINLLLKVKKRNVFCAELWDQPWHGDAWKQQKEAWNVRQFLPLQGLITALKSIIRLELKWINRNIGKGLGKRPHWWFEVHKDVHYRKEDGVILNMWWRNLWKLACCFYVIYRTEHFRNSLTIFNLLHEIIKSLCMCTGKWFYSHKLEKSESCVTRYFNAHKKERNSPFCCRNALWHDRRIQLPQQFLPPTFPIC